ncbi:MAG: cytochrome P450 [Streptosporangiales bacterium]|nr:cytochrome P450 [Streptosporangiales bacterium]
MASVNSPDPALVRAAGAGRPEERLSDMTGLIPIGETNAHADPQIVYDRLRAQWGTVAPVELEPGINAWLVMGHAELISVLRRERSFAKNAAHWRDLAEGRVRPDSPLLVLMSPRPNAWMADAEEHRRLRAPIDAAVHGLLMRDTRRHAQEACTDVIADFADRGRADLVSDYALMIPTMAVGRLLGLGLSAARQLQQAQLDLFSGGEKAQAGLDRFMGVLAAQVAARTAQPADDMTTVIVQHPNLTANAERVHTMAVMIAAASENIMAWIAGTLQLMLTDERFSGRMHGGLLGIDDALDEVLWFEPPVSNLPARYALHDIELGGRMIRKGDPLILGFGPAQADLRAGTDEWSRIDNRSHVSWGAGPHMCPAHAPGRLIVRTAVESVLHQLPGVRLTVPAHEIGRLESPWTRCPAALPVTFTAARRASW